MKKVNVWITVRKTDNDNELIRVFDSHDEIFGLYDFTEEHVVSEKTYKKLMNEDFDAKRYGNTIRAYRK